MNKLIKLFWNDIPVWILKAPTRYEFFNIILVFIGTLGLLIYMIIQQ